jgi:hypothetical protein
LRPARVAVLALVVALGCAGVARGELAQEDNVLLSFNGGIAPHALPRSATAPVAVWIESTVKAVDGSDPPPQVREIAIAINRNGRIFDRGLPTCKVRQIQPATETAARRICGGAIVGSGHVSVRVLLPKQNPFTFEGTLLAFHASRSGGHRRILAQVYGRRPPSSFVLTFKLAKRRGEFGTVLRTRLPASASKWAYVTHFDMRLRRTYLYRGQRRSYISAACAAPAGLPGTLYPFARASFTFADETTVSQTLVRDCKVSG